MKILALHLHILDQDLIKDDPQYITKENQSQIYSVIYILKYDPVERVQIEAARTWQIYVDNQPKILKSCISILLEKSLEVLTKGQEELLEMGRNCLRSLVEKFDDKLIPASLTYFEKGLENANDNETIGICNALYQMVDASRSYSIHHFVS